MDHTGRAATTDDELTLKARDRIEVMESPEYVFPEPFGRVDWTAAGLVIAATVVWLIAGIWM